MVSRKTLKKLSVWLIFLSFIFPPLIIVMIIIDIHLFVTWLFGKRDKEVEKENESSSEVSKPKKKNSGLRTWHKLLIGFVILFFVLRVFSLGFGLIDFKSSDENVQEEVFADSSFEMEKVYVDLSLKQKTGFLTDFTNDYSSEDDIGLVSQEEIIYYDWDVFITNNDDEPAIIPVIVELEGQTSGSFVIVNETVVLESMNSVGAAFFEKIYLTELDSSGRLVERVDSRKTRPLVVGRVKSPLSDLSISSADIDIGNYNYATDQDMNLLSGVYTQPGSYDLVVKFDGEEVARESLVLN